MPDIALSVENLTSGYGPVTVLRNVSMSVAKGEAVAILGSNGAGKSTLLKTIVGLLRIEGGAVRVGPHDGTGRSPEAIAGWGVRLIMEGRQLFNDMSVRDNLILGAYAIRRDSKEILKRIAEVYDLFPLLAERSGQRVGGLSGGQQQMVAIGRGLMGRPDVLLLDEPSLGLAPQISQQVFNALRRLRELGSTMVIVEQNAMLALSFVDRAYVLERGRVTIEGRPVELIDDPRIQASYLGLRADATHLNVAQS
jgi:branched-chain amino acid transport system ATP-binding protein